jgi:DNA repair protein RecO (recombination protein O)
VKARSRPKEDRALVLRRYPFGESSLVVHLLTPGSGKVHVLAKGAFRPTSGYYAVFDWFDTLAVGWREQRASDLGVATRGRILARRRGLTATLPRYRAGLALLELLDLAAQPGRDESGLFGLAERWLDLLGSGATDPSVALVAFDLAFLENLGLAPALASCAACGGAVAAPRGKDGRIPFATGAGGCLCPRCGTEARSAGRRVESLPVNVVRIAASLAGADPEHLSRFRVDARALGQVRALVERFLDYHLETRPRSRSGARAAATP